MAEQTPGEHHQRLPSRMDYERITKTTRILQDFDALRAYFQRTERGHTCAQCGYSTMNLANLLFHVLGVHLIVAAFRCHVCNLTTTNYTNIRQHLRRKHNLSDDQHFYQCSECDITSTAPLGIVYHYFESHVDSTNWNVPGRPRASPFLSKQDAVPSSSRGEEDEAVNHGHDGRNLASQPHRTARENESSSRHHDIRMHPVAPAATSSSAFREQFQQQSEQQHVRGRRRGLRNEDEEEEQEHNSSSRTRGEPADQREDAQNPRRTQRRAATAPAKRTRTPIVGGTAASGAPSLLAEPLNRGRGGDERSGSRSAPERGGAVGEGSEAAGAGMETTMAARRKSAGEKRSRSSESTTGRQVTSAQRQQELERTRKRMALKNILN